MKKILFLFIFLSISFTAFSQVKVGILLSPGISFNRLIYEVDPNVPDIRINKQGSGLRFLAGPEFSFYITENYAFVTGIYYALKRAGYSINDGGVNVNTNEVYNLQYIQLPATFKLFTNEIATDMKIYFQLGGSADIKISEKASDVNYKMPARFRPFDVSLILGSGVELQMGENTFFLVGVRYTRGLLDIVKSSDNSYGKYINMKADMISLDLGIRF